MLTIKDLHSGYTRGANVLKGIELQVNAGERLAIMGRNGMGKTLLAKTIMGLVRASSGEILFDGNAITGFSPNRISNQGIAYVPQGREIFTDFTVLENLQMGYVGKSHIKRGDYEQMFEWFPILRERQKQVAGTMSGGQMQQLAIARALIGKPKLIVLDEPSEGIQPSIVQEIGETLTRICQEQSLTVIVIEQNFELVEALAQDVAFMENGVISAKKPTSALSAEPELINQYMGL